MVVPLTWMEKREDICICLLWCECER